MARDLDPFKLSSPRIFLVRMMVFLILCGLVIVVLHKQIVVAFMGERADRMAISPTTMRGLMDSIATRLDEARDISRYMTSLLVFLGLLDTFWGLIETVGPVGGVIQNLKVGGEA